MSEQLDRMWAGWRAAYLTDADRPRPTGCVMCAVIDEATTTGRHLVAVGPLSVVLLNAFPYNAGHVLVLPRRHIDVVDGLTPDEHDALWAHVRDASTAIKTAYEPDGVNIGLNEGAAAGAGLPDHLHAHVLPRWSADTSFTTTVAGVRVVPEALDVTTDRLQRVWSSGADR